MNKGSAHTNACFRSIPQGVFGRLGKLTSCNRKMLKTRIDKVYPDHYEAPKIANLTPKCPPTMKQILKKTRKMLKTKKEREEKNARRKNSWQIFFCVGVSKVFKGKGAVHLKLKELRNKYNLKWLRISMYYHKFSNLSKLFGGDISGKLMRNVKSLDFMGRYCNCN